MEKNVIERALLCSLFLDQVAILEVVGLLRPEMFSDPDHGFIYEAFTDLFNRNKRPDLILVEEEMKKKDPERYVKMGGMAYLSDGMETVRLEHNAVEYAREILHHYLLGCMHKLFVQKASECLQYGMDYLKVIENCERDLLRLRMDNSESDSLLPLSEVMKLSIDDHLDRMSRKDDSVRMLTGINGLDGLTGGLYRKEVLVLGGLPSDGKTALAMFMAMNMARQGKHVLHFSFEMTGEQTAARFFAGYAGVEAARLRIGGLREGDIDRMKRYAAGMEKTPYYFTNVSSMSLDALRAEIMLRSRKGECDVVVIDYLHTLAPLTKRGETQESVIRHTITVLKRIAVEANCAMLVVSQLNREVLKRSENGFVPIMSDLRDSGAIEFVADCVVIIGCPERFGKNTAQCGSNSSRLIKLYVLKNRNGSTGIAEVYRNDTYTSFVNPGGNLHFED